MLPCLFFVLLNRIGLQGNHRQCVPQQGRPSLYGWEFMGQLCEKAGREPCMYCTPSSLANFHLLGLMLLISTSTVLMETQAANSLGFPAMSVFVLAVTDKHKQAEMPVTIFFSLLRFSKFVLNLEAKKTHKKQKRKTPCPCCTFLLLKQCHSDIGTNTHFPPAK